MAPRPEFSPQTLSVLATLSSRPSDWHHGYDVAKETGLKSGTLYPILIRLADRGLLEADWEDEQVPGRPRRHLYRLTADGLAAVERAAVERAAAEKAARARPATPTRRQSARSRIQG